MDSQVSPCCLFLQVWDLMYFCKEQPKEQQSRSVFEKTTGSMLIGSLLLLFLLQAVFGAGGIRALPFSVITAMSNSKIKGIFLQRWDVLFAVFFLGMVCGALISGFTVLGTCSERLLPGKKKKWKWWLMAAAASAAACVSPGLMKKVYSCMSDEPGISWDHYAGGVIENYKKNTLQIKKVKNNSYDHCSLLQIAF